MNPTLIAALLGGQAGMLLAMAVKAHGTVASPICAWSSGFVAACAFVEWLHWRKKS